MQIQWRVAKAKSRAHQVRLSISRAIQRFGGLKAAESRVVSGDWPKSSWGDLRSCLEALVDYRLHHDEILLAAPFIGTLYDLYRVEDAGPPARDIARRAADRLHVAARKRTASPECRNWEMHFQTLTARICLDTRTYEPGEISGNILRLEAVANDASLLPFVRSEARVELAGQCVALDLERPEVERRLKNLRENLDPSYAGPGAEWVLAAARLRPEIDYHVRRKKSAAVERQIEEYGKIVLPQKSFRHASLWVGWKRALGEPVAVAIPEMTLHLAVPPIGMWGLS